MLTIWGGELPTKPTTTKPPRPKRDRIQELEDEMEKMNEKTGTRGAAFLLSNGRRVRNTKYNTHGEFLQDALKNLKYPTRNRTDNREWNMLVKKKRAPVRYRFGMGNTDLQIEAFSQMTDAQRKYLKDTIIEKNIPHDKVHLTLGYMMQKKQEEQEQAERLVRRGLGAAGPEEEEAGAKIAAIIATLYPQMNKAQQTQAKLLISRITKRPDKQVLRDIAKFLARFGASNPAISKKIEALFKNINKQPIAVAVEQSPKTPEKAQEKADEKLDGFVTKMMAFLTASGLIISAQESRKIRLKEARSNKKGIPKSGDKEIPTTPDGIPRKKSQREILAILTTKHDPRVDDVCIPFHGLPFKLGDPLRPKLPLHYGCRCTWIDKETGKDLGQL